MRRIALVIAVGVVGCGDDATMGADAAPDAPADSATDANRDAATDASIDAATDAALDAPPDASACAGVDCGSLTDDCNIGTCNLGDGTCVRVPRSDGTACNDGNACTVGETCSSGVCRGGI